MSVAIQAESLAKSFGTTRALDGVDLEVASGTVLGLLGPNGAGKTTLVSQILGLIQPTSGSIHIDGVDVTTDGRSARRADWSAALRPPGSTERTSQGFPASPKARPIFAHNSSPTNWTAVPAAGCSNCSRPVPSTLRRQPGSGT